jgi:hypothetical protein
MGALAGFIFGYVLGMKQGPDGFAKLRKALEEVVGSPEAKSLLEKLPSMVGGLSGMAMGSMAPPAAETGPGPGEGRYELGPEQLVGMVRAFAESDAIQSIVAGGMDFARGVLERFTTRKA